LAQVAKGISKRNVRRMYLGRKVPKGNVQRKCAERDSKGGLRGTQAERGISEGTARVTGTWEEVLVREIVRILEKFLRNLRMLQLVALRGQV
jgi:hypothetical protein